MIKFYNAEWCNPCKTMKENLGEEILSQLTLVDVDHEPEEAIDASIRSIPTFIKLDDEGNEIDRKTGSMSKSSFIEWMDE